MRFERVEFLKRLAAIATYYREVWFVTVDKLYMTKEFLKGITCEAGTVTASESHIVLFISRAVAGE